MSIQRGTPRKLTVEAKVSLSFSAFLAFSTMVLPFSRTAAESLLNFSEVHFDSTYSIMPEMSLVRTSPPSWKKVYESILFEQNMLSSFARKKSLSSC